MSSMSTPDAEAHHASAGDKAGGLVRALDAGATILSRIGGALSALLIVVVLALTAAAVVARYAIGQPIPGVDEATGFLVVAVVMCGAAEALRTGHHIRIDLALGAVGPRARRWLEAWSSLAVLAVAALLGWTAWHSVLFSYDFDAYSPGQLELPMWIPQATLPLGALLLGIAALSRLLRALVPGLGDGDQPPGGHP